MPDRSDVTARLPPGPSGALRWKLGVAFPFLFSNSGTKQGVPLSSTPPHPTKTTPGDYSRNSRPGPVKPAPPPPLSHSPPRGSMTCSQKHLPLTRAFWTWGLCSQLGARDPGPSTHRPTALSPLTMLGSPNEQTHLSCCWCSPWSPGAQEGPWGTRGSRLDWRPAAAGSPAEPAGSLTPDLQCRALPPRRSSSDPAGTGEAGADPVYKRQLQLTLTDQPWPLGTAVGCDYANAL